MAKTVFTRKSKKNRTRKNRNPKLLKLEQEIVLKFIEILNTVKLYHWKTYSYPTHKATDELYSKLNENIDHFMEVLLGKQGDRIDLTMVHNIPLKDFTSINQMKREIEEFKSYLVGLNNDTDMKVMSNSDLYNIRDEILGDLNQFLYLLTFT
jgi:DNA-binding ferritin-like protein